MPRVEPEIITGLKSPAHFPERGDASAATAPSPVQLAQQHAELSRPEPRAPGEKAYHSRFRSIRVQVKTPQDRMDPSTGAIIRGETKYAQFVNGECRTSDPETQAAIERCRSFQTGDIWDADKVRQDAAAASYDALVDSVLSNPELADKFMKDARLKKVLNLDDFPLPAVKPSEEVRSTKPNKTA